MQDRMPVPEPAGARSGASLKQLLIACIVVSVTGVCFLLLYLLPATSPRPTTSELLRQSRLALARGQMADAERLALQVPENDRRYPKAVLLAGEAMTRAGRLQDAAEIYSTVPLEAAADAVLIHFSRAEVLLHAARISEAEQTYRNVVAVEPGYVEAHSRLAFILGVTGRRAESRDALFTILRSGAASLNELVLLADLGRPIDEGEILSRWAETNPDDPLIKLGMATRTAADGEVDAALAMLQQLSSKNPGLAAAQVHFGELLTERRPQALHQWHDSLPQESSNWPELWFVRGRWAQLAQQPEVAAYCFLKLIEQRPFHRRANFELGIVLHRLQHPAADDFSTRARKLLELSTELTDARESEGKSEQAFQNILRILKQQKRIWEACAWAAMAKRSLGDRPWIRQILSEFTPLLSAELPLHPESDPAMELVNADRFPSFHPERLAAAEVKGTAAVVAPQNLSGGSISFTESAAVGIPFVYFNAHDESTQGARIQEQTGGGASVVDFDRDSFPDLYFVQGADWKHKAVQPTLHPRHADQLFRNLRGTEFESVTERCGIQELRFGQCCAVGDINEDGFPDLYIANVGSNTLYLNQGDGTFTVHAADAGEPQKHFTSSSLIADINGDGWNDLFDANYVTGRDVYHRICGGRACSPAAFDGVADVLHQSDGHGGYGSVVAATPRDDAKGLGAVAISLNDPAKPAVFVANDQTPNFLLQYRKDENGGQFTDDALSSGLAYSQEGLVTAAMGIAAGDADNDGLIDLFISNFQDESNCLYLQTSAGFFNDTALAAGLQAPSYSYVGWGTQFLDADLNGDPDLVLCNGHVGSYFDEGRPPKMPCQFFRNTGKARFTELSADRVGSFFSEKFYGRSIAKLDWNRDGRLDFVMVPIRENVRLLKNDSQTDGRFINVRLSATKSARDAFFTTAQLHTDSRKFTRQLVAGGGYHASNERMLQFGLMKEKARSLVIHWPSGSVSRLSDPPSNVEIHFVEGRAVAAVTRQDSSSQLIPVASSESKSGSVGSRSPSVNVGRLMTESSQPE